MGTKNVKSACFLLLGLFGCAGNWEPPTTNQRADAVITRPTDFPDWATNPNWVSGPDIGQPTKALPVVGRIADGWRNGDVPPPQEQNYEMNLLGQWIRYLDDRRPHAIGYFAGVGYSFGPHALATIVPITSYGVHVPNVEAGDLLKITWDVTISCSAGGFIGFYPEVLDNATLFRPMGNAIDTISMVAGASQSFSFNLVYTVVVGAGAVDVMGGLQSAPGNNAFVYHPSNVSVIHIRP